jgi:glycerol-3-phosphate dehydrogenase (NAD(P)+)
MRMTNLGPFSHIGVIGAGAWGTALAVATQHAANGSTGRVTLWAREADVARALSAGEGNPVFLKGMALPVIHTVTDMAALASCDAILAVPPAQHMRTALTAFAPHARAGLPVALCAKGIEQGSLKLMTEVLAETLPDAVPAVLSGPSFAIDVARGLPTAVTLACTDHKTGERWLKSLGRPGFRPYLSEDLIGAEAGGAVKNVLAIACGIVEGRALGKSAHAALIARGFAEMTRFGVALGGRAETLAGLCGLGDLVLTCSSPQSRNMSFGFAIGQGERAQDVLAARAAVTEGVATAPALLALAERLSVDMPICAAVDAILSGKTDLDGAIDALLNRPLRTEGH